MVQLICAVCTIVLLAPAASAQTKPDFSGTWTLDEARSSSPTYPEYIGPVVWVITQTDAEMAVDIRRGPKTFTLHFKMVAKPLAEPGEIPSYRAYWEGDRLVTETTQNIQGQAVMTREARTLLADGREMLVERLVQVQHGYTFRGAQSYSTAKDTFVRTSR
jgi:hypothetical protein